MVGEPAIAPPTASFQTSFGALVGAGPARRPEWRASPPSIANGGDPGCGPSSSPPSALAPGPSSTRTRPGAGSTQALASHTRVPLQSVSLEQPTSLALGAPQAAAASAPSAIQIF